MFKSRKRILELEAANAQLEARNRSLETTAPTGIAGMAGLAIAQYFEQWEQTGRDPHTNIPVTADFYGIERSAISDAINKSAALVLRELSPQQLVEFAHALNPEIVEFQLKTLDDQTLAEAIVKAMLAEELNAWVASNGDPLEFAKLLDAIDQKTTPYQFFKEQLSETGMIDLNTIPPDTTIKLFLYRESRSLPAQKLERKRGISLHEKKTVVPYNTCVSIRRTITEDESFVRVDEASGATKIQTQQPTKILTEYGSLEPNTIALGYILSSRIGNKTTNLGKLNGIDVIVDKEE